MELKTDTQFPRVAIKFCVQCKWNLRAAYYAQELLQTFTTTLGEVSLIPVTGGTFTITLYHRPVSSEYSDGDGVSAILGEIEEHLLWDRKRDSGFPETKELKNRVRNVIDPERDMGHVDRALKKGKPGSEGAGGGVAYKDIIDGSTESAATTASTTTTKVENGEKSHADHAAAGATVDDCEECREAGRG
ncbi:hypothetical protein H2198_002366 [Neophaeococcomyces mojaviensis]|uniref:Uncharacterized protein n=1 Tax=Neophaeococcomyces mojaviensis TaxID=3383035 RepID=A0ACC3AEI0_9EURO|nr:hypothetical protein H2198_002366 [Knufia sp. JES_112]